MTLRAMYSAATGMRVNEFQLDTIANNLANAGTTAFKKSRSNFEDLFYEHLKIPGIADAGGQITGVGHSVGLGARVASTQVDHRQGSLLETKQPLDMVVFGQGFFKVDDSTGNPLYTRAGNFTLNANGDVILASSDRGRPLSPGISVPQGAKNISISSDGVMTALLPGATTPSEIGRITLTTFPNPQGLIQVGENLFMESLASGTATDGTPALNGVGQVRQGFLEASNVEPVREIVDLIKTQRNFEMNSQVVQAADQVLQLVANLRRF
ncbi:MAG: flagellar basal-body rod protein FlgG [Planctomycetaceae bacterium]